MLVGLEASIADSEENSATVKNANIVLESGDGDELKVSIQILNYTRLQF